MSGHRNEKNNYEVKITDDDEQNVENIEKSIPKELEAPINNRDPEKQPTERSEAEKYLDQLQRLQAEFLNYKRRVEKERLELSILFKSELAGLLLPVIDDFERMLNHADEKHNELLKGVKLIYQKLMDILKEQGLTLIDAKGHSFDPRIHEAMLIENIENGEDNIVAEEWRKGYFFNDRLLRPAQVKVLKLKQNHEN